MVYRWWADEEFGTIFFHDHLFANYRQKHNEWQQRLGELSAAGRRGVVWGAGSKGVTFLNALNAGEEIAAVVDINPRKRGRHVPVSGHPVVAPADLVADPPATAIVLNPVYVDEIGAQLAELGLSTQVHSPMHLVRPTAAPGAAGAARPGRFP